ncbi:MFS general substrate transporter [Hypoxylon rubiginosum]|uniref:MFS general substrate transporter n=1 Tax=Hypoxylon rubiginosum TaxID=110542 RepID=A0ACB9Z790_9PEZI|nr:MFS general substrate transporter [Hypoxylon rubiginosum]
MSDVEHPSATALSGDVEKAARDSSQAATGISSPHVDNSDPDEALKLVAGEAVVLTPEDEKRLLRKIDRNMMPLLCVVYGLNYLDKTTLSYASVMGIRTDLHLVGQDYSWIASVFYFGYLFWEWPTNRLLQRLPLAKYSAFNVIMWGLTLCCLAAVKDFGGAMTVRFFLGAFEAAVSPGFALFTSQWYTKKEQGTRVAWWFSFNGWAQIVGGFVAYGIAVGTEAHPILIKSWQLIFLVTGFFTAFMGGLFLYFMPDSQLNARFLTQRERVMAVERIRINQQGVGNKHFKWYQCKEALTDPMIWAFVLFSAIASIPNGGVSNYFSQLIVSFGFSENQSLLLGAPGGAIQIITLLIAGHCGDRFKNRIFFGAAGVLIAAIGLLLILLLPLSNSGGRLAGYYLYQSSSTGFVALLGLISTNVAGWTKKTTAAAMYLVAYCVGNIIGPQVFQSTDAPQYRNANITILVCMFVAFAILIFINIWCRRQNKIKATVRASPGYAKVDGQEFLDLTDRENPEFIYSL